MKTSRKTFLLMALLMSAGFASAQVVIEKNVYGGGNIGTVSDNTTVTVNGGTIGRKLTLEERKNDANSQIIRITVGNVYGGGNGYKVDSIVENVPVINQNYGLVKGNTNVTIGGDAVVRHAVYGGGNIGSVGTFTFIHEEDDGANYTAGGKATVTIQGNAIIGPTKTDLTTATSEELEAAGVTRLEDYIDSTFKYLGCNEGWVFGSSRGLAGRELRHLSFADSTIVTVTGSANVVGDVFGGGENGHVQKGTNVTINGNSVIGGFPLHGEDLNNDDTYNITEGIYANTTVHLKGADAELYEDKYGVGRRIFRGNVFGGGRGTDYVSYLEGNLLCFYAGRVYGNTHLTIGGNAKVYNRAYGGGTIASVGTYTYQDPNDVDHHNITGLLNNTGHAYVIINGGTIGTNGLNNGEVFGGGHGMAGDASAQATDENYVGYTHVTMTGGTVKHSVYGGAANGHVLHDTEVIISEATPNTTFIGTTVNGGWHSNVYGGGGGTAQYKKANGQTHHSITAGRVYGNTNVSITGGTIYHNVYGGGALASVGRYLEENKPYVSGGQATVTITGGTIGIDGNENGMVFGSGRGEIDRPGAFMDSLTYVAYSTVNIGQATTTTTTIGEGEEAVTTTTTTYSGDAKINGSVYGSGENGHVYLESEVNVYSGTIGCDDYDPADPDPYFAYRGNVYGAGCGTDMYDSDNNGRPDTYNPNAGYVQGNATVNIYGGYISRNVYGGGAMASVGIYDHTKTDKHDLMTTEAALSWPYYLEFISIPDASNTMVSTGKTTINIMGGHIGTVAAPIISGDVYGSARGESVGDLYVYDTLALARETEININFVPNLVNPVHDSTKRVIVGSVYGSGENGQVYEKTKITMTNGLVGGSVFGGGKGTDKYRGTLYKLANNSAGYVVVNDTLIHSITAGKVYGSTEVVINGGQINHNVYGGGNLASVGKGNYIGYGEMTNTTSGPATPYQSSGKAKVTINGGTIGTGSYLNEHGNVNGFVYGSSKGITYPDIANPESIDLYNFSHDFYVGYTNETEVVIGPTTGSTGPRIYGSVFGGGENGHVRWNTNVTVNNGEIGEACTATEAHSTDPEWLYRGNVYGAGRGIDKIGTTDDYCNSAGSVTLNTLVTINGGTIHRNVYGGGSMASVGPSATGYNAGRSLNRVNIYGGNIGTVVNEGEDDEYLYGGNVFGAGRGNFDLLTTANIGSFATSDSTEVHLYTGADIFGNVYGGGEIGQTKKDTYVYVHGGIAEGSVYGAGKGELTDEKAALVLGNATVNMTGGSVERSIYGGGELGNVGTYTGYYNASEIVNTAHVLNEPKGCEENTGLATVLISGGNVGVNGSLMPVPGSNADDDDRGWVFCGGRGDADTIASPKANLMGIVGSTYLEISKTETTAPLITASVYGGCENGLVLGNTHVKIAGGQIGTGLVSKTTTPPTFDPMYTENTWNTAIAAVNGGNISAVNTAAAQFHECDAWPYGDGTGHYKIYDYFYGNHMDPDDDETPLYEPAGSATTGSNGHSFFGNVFGGGSGYYPIAPGKWRRSAGRVWGNTHVEITGGHILNSVYGGNETTDVMGKCFVEMSDGTVGVPRTSAQITANPVRGHLYGAGMGDPRQAFDAWNNVDSTRVEITGGVIFGSVFGGGENGHVLDSTRVVIAENALIGTTGLSGYDGLVFGGGKGDECNIDPYPEDLTTTPHTPSHANFAPGRVGGNTRLTMSGGKVLGNLYGGGFVARIGVGVDGGFEAFESLVNEGEEDEYTTYSAEHHGLTKVEVSGGIIGNLANDQGYTMLRDAHKSGNVYGGGCGDPKEYVEDDLGRVANSIVNITDSPTICGSVFGGGQMANVGHWNSYDAWYTEGTSTSVVNITGTPTIGTALEFKDSDIDYSHHPGDWTHYDTIRFVTYGETTNDTTYLRMLTHTRTGNVYGGGQGEVVLTAVDAHGKRHVVGLEQGHCGATEVHIGTTGNPRIYGSVYGGSEQGAVWGGTEVHIAGGTIGTMDIVADSLDTTADAWVPSNNGYYYGSVFGGSYGKDFYNNFTVDNTILPRVIDSVNELAGRVYGNTLVDITGGTIRGNVFGGGDMASVGYWTKRMSGGDLVDLVPATYPDLTMGPLAGKIKGNTTVNVTGSTTVIGPLDGTGLNAYVFGGGKGFSKDPNELRMTYANVDSTSVTIRGGRIWGSVLGGGSDSHVLGSTSVAVHTGANIGTDGLSTWDGNIFGGGRNFQNTNHTNGRVAGNVNITMDGGTIQGSIFGGGRMALTGVDVNGGVDAYLTGQTYDDEHHGLVTITVTGGSIGNDDGDELLNGSDESVGDIFGSGKGDTKAYEDILAGRVANTIVNVSNARVFGSVFGGGEMAGIGYWHDNATHTKTLFYNNTGSSQVTIGGTAEIGTDYEFSTTYATNPGHEWTVYDEEDGTIIHTCTGNVFGGSQGDVDPECPSWVSMGRSRTATVTINSGTIKSRVFGGAEQGSIAENTYVTINGGTIGTKVNQGTTNEYLFGGVHGGGYGSQNPLYNVTTYENDSTEFFPEGSDLWRADYLAGRVYGDATVNVLGGTIRGDVFGGAAYAYIGGYGTSPNGNVTLNIGNSSQYDQPNVGTTILGSVFGANNRSGTPYGNVAVNVYHTKHTTANMAPETPEGGWTDQAILDSLTTQEYAIKEVFGGGNRGSFVPNPTRAYRSTTVHVYECENTIRDLYGGSNAADIGSDDSKADANVIVDGGCFERVFGGGNGSVSTANVHGTATTRINAGLIQEVYGGGNSDGLIDNIDLQITHDNAISPTNPTGCDDFIYDVFGGNNEAEVIGDIIAGINCGDGYQYEFYGGNNNATVYGNVTTNVFGGTTDYLFGGSKGSTREAHIRRFPSYDEIEEDQALPANQRKYSARLLEYMGYDPEDEEAFHDELVGTGGNVTLNLFGGIIRKAAFGGCDVNGSIDGKITVNVYNAGGTCSLDLKDLYGAGRNTDYAPENPNLASPEVNIIHGTVKGNVYGGGQGISATTTANPVVNMGYQTSMATLVSGLNTTITSNSDLTPPALAAYAPYVNGNIYGGGQLAHVNGSTTVNVCAGEIGEIGYIYKHNNTTHTVYDSIYHKEYDVTNHLIGGNVYGGGRGSTTNIDDGRVLVNSNVNVAGGIVYNNVYGGGEMASVGEHTNVYNSDDELIDIAPVANTGLATVNITGGQVGPAPKVDVEHGYNIPIGLNGVDGYVFGGSKGDGDTDDNRFDCFANVNNTNVTVNISSDLNTTTNRLWGSVFGGAEDGHVLGDAEVHYVSGLMGTTGTTTYDGNIFGGGRNYDFRNTIAGRVRGDITVEMTGGHLLGNIYGGGRLGVTGINFLGQMIADDATHTYGHITVSVEDGTIGMAALDSDVSGNVFGGGKGRYLDDDGWQICGFNANTFDMWLWSDLAKVKQTQVTISGGAVHGSVFGGGETSLVDRTAEVNITGGTVGGVSGTTGNNYGSVFGGGKGFLGVSNIEANPKSGQVAVSTEVNMSGGHVYENVYGGGEVASVGDYIYEENYYGTGFDMTYLSGGTTNVNITGGEVGPVDASSMSGYVFGGGQGVSNDASEYFKVFSNVVDANVTISDDAQVDGSVLGGAAEGHVLGDVTIDITGGTIGIDGYSLGDGNVLGGGGNQTLSNYTAGRVGGNIGITMSGGLVKGSIYGGGYAGLAGVDEDGDFYTTDLDDHGNVTIEISGGTVGTDAAIASHFVGNVFGSGKGELGDDKFGATQSTDVTISESARILGNVYGGGETANVERNTTVNIEGGTIGVIDYIYKKGHTSGALDSIVHVNHTGNVFGGGKGDASNEKFGLVRGSTNVNINGGHVFNNVYGGGELASVGEVEITYTDETHTTIKDFTPVAGTGYTKVTLTGGQVGPAPTFVSKVGSEATANDSINIPIGLTGFDGYVFGGGKGNGDDSSNAYKTLANVNYACVEVNIPANADTTTNRLWGSIFGGAEDGHVLGSDTVKLVSGLIGTYGTTSYDGNIFGGGRNFSKKNFTAGRTRGNITVEMTGGKLRGSLFGGGRLALTGVDLNGNIVPDEAGENGKKYGAVKVMVKGGKVGNEKLMEHFTKFSMGDVFGGGKGDMKGIDGHPAASALFLSVVHNTEVQVSDSARIYGSVFGGGEMANVGEFTWKRDEETGAITDIELTGGGHTKVTVSGGVIGADRMRMDYTLVGGSGADKYNLMYNTDIGHVFGGGEGLVGNPDDPSWGTAHTKKYGVMSILDLMATVNTTEVNIKEDAFVKGSVYGGSMNGHVLDSTYVLMEGGQIGAGNGESADLQYTDGQFVDPANVTVTASLAPTYHWDYGREYTIGGKKVKRYDPFDPILVSQDTLPSDGKTWFGNVYGGGSGYYPYIVRIHNNVDSTVWNRSAGLVRGNTRVEVTGGHVLSCVYGGCETTDVLGHATVIVEGSGSTKPTIGVPRIASDIKACPVPSFVYGSGNGDPRTNFNTWTNVDSTYVRVDNSIVYGCVFGGGMDGHVLRNTHVEILGGTIGIFGTTGAEGNVFGGGHGSNPVALTAGGVGGNTQVDIKDGRMLGSIFGGGNNGSVGIQFTAPDHEDYGEILDDDEDGTHGYSTVNISGGNIGNDDVTGRTGGNVYGGCRGNAGAPGSIYQRMAKVKETHVNISEDIGKQTFIRGSVFGSGEDGHVLRDTYVTVKGGQIGGDTYVTSGEPELCKDIYHGNVYGGGRGLDTYTDETGVHYSITAGKVSGNTHVLVKGGRITRNVYGGGNLASVGEYRTVGSDNNVPVSGTGLAQVVIKGGKIGVYEDEDLEHGNVFGSSHGLAGSQYVNLAYVHNTEVRLDSAAIVYGSVFGGGEDGHVNQNSKVSVNGEAVVGHEEDVSTKGNVYGGGRGIDEDEEGNLSPTAGLVKGLSHVYINDGTVWGSVYGGGHTSVTQLGRVVNINGGTVEGNVFGGCNSSDEDVELTSLKTVNVRDGYIKGNVYGCSNLTGEGDSSQEPSASTPYWTSFVNITGGTIDGSVYGAGYTGRVEGSVCVNIGYYPITHAPNNAANLYYSDAEGDDPITPSATKDLVIKGSVYGGSNLIGTEQTTDLWNTYDITGYSKVYIDGTGYDTRNKVTPYMDIQGGLYGCGTHCESGTLGREVILRKYGHRNADASTGELISATRTLKTAQRISNFVIDESNVNFAGYEDISGKSDSLYAVVKIKDNFFVANASSMVLGSIASPAYIDSVQNVHSYYLRSGDIYQNADVPHLSSWGWIGIQVGDPTHPGKSQLYHIYNGAVESDSLSFAQENAIRFNGRSRMWVRYHVWEPEELGSSTHVDRQYYGELKGFFRMRADYFQPKGFESFAYARPKLTVANGGVDSGTTPVNNADGGFLSYNTLHNYFTNDGGLSFTSSVQYPYSNLMERSLRDDMEEYRQWSIPEITGNAWYVDGRTGGTGVNDMANGRGLYPDMPKLTISAVDADGKRGVYAGGKDWEGHFVTFDQTEDAIYVVGTVSSTKELLVNTTGVLNTNPTKPLRLYRYPGGHTLSPSASSTPSANYKALVEVDACAEGESFTLNKVTIDGLFGYEGFDEFNFAIPSTFVQTNVEEPLVITHAGSELNLNDSTTLKHGYNKMDANDYWYTNADYKTPVDVYQGAGLFVDSLATVNVRGKVYIHGNKQCRMVGDQDHPVDCNVYLPAFETHLNITGSLDESTNIGVTNPKRKKTDNYLTNTLSPVAASSDPTLVEAAWRRDNFHDDQHWFFGNKYHTTYYEPPTLKGASELYNGWTWANVVRTQPAGFDYTNIDSPEDLAWLISKSVGMNGATATNFANVPVMRLTQDLDMGQYVWVPLGDSIAGSTDYKPFASNFDGQGHLITRLNVDFIGDGDSRYERQNYGMFGYVKHGSVNRTFVVSGKMDPEIVDAETLHVGGLVGSLHTSTLSNSESAVEIVCPDKSGNGIVVGGLVAKMVSGEIHSSMAMPWVNNYSAFTGYAGGLVGDAVAGRINNSFVNAKFTINEDNKVGGLIGKNDGATMRNCYATWHDCSVTDAAYFRGIVNYAGGGSIDSCYVKQNFSLTDCGTHSKNYSEPYSSDKYGYMYSDNTVPLSATADTALFRMLNNWVDKKSGHTYAHWARPALEEINGDMPVLLLGDLDRTNEHQGSFRSVGTYAGGSALQYGGPIRDAHELDEALARTNATSDEDYLFIYGDVVEVSTGFVVTQSKVSIHEDASILDPGVLSEIRDNYVGITFDNSHKNGEAASTPGINYGLNGMGMGPYPLPRDWHMFSSPLTNAPLGFNYKEDNDANSSNYNNPWNSISDEFSWLQYTGSNGNARYWMYGWDNSLSPSNPSAFNSATWVDGYFPSQTTTFGAGLIEGTDEENCYPYGMDLYTWFEPEYHWINFKRNGPNHWHSDNDHEQIEYVPLWEEEPTLYTAYQNEDELIVGKGYMGAIATETFLQSHGNLNAADQTEIVLTKTPASKLPGWNLVGNPYHGYLDFDAVAGDDGNAAILSQREGHPFYVVYDADGFTGYPESAFLYYPMTGSDGGAYADRFLHPHQGFYVRTETHGSSLQFTKDMLATRQTIADNSLTSHFRDWHPTYPLVNLFLSSDNGCSDVTVIEFERPEWGGARKLKELRQGNGVFYAQHDDTHYAALFTLEGTERVPLWFEAKEDDIFTIKWNTANGDFHSMYLIDNIAGVQYDMLRNHCYSFEGHKSDYPARFYIVFDVTGVEEDVQNVIPTFAFFDGSQWVVTGDGELELIDVQGRILAQKHVSGQSRISLNDVACGVYLFRLTNSEETRVQKVIVTR